MSWLLAWAEPNGPGMLETLSQWLRDWVAPPLQALLAPLDRWLDGLPAWAGPACAVALFVLAGACVLFLKREFIYRGAPDQARWRDLRIWALLALLPYIAVYLIF